MNANGTLQWVVVCLGLAGPALAAPRRESPADGGPAVRAARPPATPALTAAARYALRCQGASLHRTNYPQGTLLWGTTRSAPSNESSTTVASVELGRLVAGDARIRGLRLEGGLLGAVPSSPRAADRDGGGAVVGAVLRGTDGEGRPVEVAICGAEPAPDDPTLRWYRLQVWNEAAQAWEDPCAGTARAPDPRALAVGGVWDARGGHHDAPGRFTFACESGAIAKCIRWGYKPWGSRDGRSLAELHQACTRMARADYCGDGRSHTHEDTVIDMYDRLGVLSRTTTATADWDPARAAFEAAWSPDGATCLARTRDGRPLASVLAECPGRFRAAAAELGAGDRCTHVRPGVDPGAAPLRNRSRGTDDRLQPVQSQ